MSLKHGILGLLNYAPMTGYNLKKLFDRSVNYIWTASLSQIYRELGLLEKHRYVSSYIEEQDDRPDKRVYCITEDGKNTFQKWLAECPDKFTSPKRDEFMLKIFFGASMGKSEVKKQLELFIEDRKNAIEEIDEDEKIIPELVDAASRGQTELKTEEDIYMHFIVKRAQMTNRLLIQWAEECIKELDEKNFKEAD